jgi:hypothetical protein
MRRLITDTGIVEHIVRRMRTMEPDHVTMADSTVDGVTIGEGVASSAIYPVRL